SRRRSGRRLRPSRCPKTPRRSAARSAPPRRGRAAPCAATPPPPNADRPGPLPTWRSESTAAAGLGPYGCGTEAALRLSPFLDHCFVMKRALPVVLCLCLGVAGCKQLGIGPSDVGSALGAGFGGYGGGWLGAQVGSGSGRTVATIAGA